MSLVVIESPLAETNGCPIEDNTLYACQCVMDSLLRGEFPYASHLMFNRPNLLDDKISEQRVLGMRAGLAWSAKADLCAVYIDKGLSFGMKRGVTVAIATGIAVEIRSCYGFRNPLPPADDEWLLQRNATYNR